MLYSEINKKEKEELVNQILQKFDLLFDKEEYYNHQERVYKLNKTFCGIAKARTLDVTNFTDFAGEEDGEKQGNQVKRSSSKNMQDILGKLDISLENLSMILDDLLEKKETNGESVFTSSSEDDGVEVDMAQMLSLKEKDPREDLTKIKKKRLLKNLYNYELLLKAHFYEKAPENLPTEEKEPEKEEKVVTVSNCHTPVSKMSLNDPKTMNNTPVIKKSFFEDQEIKKSLDRRRHSCFDGSDLNFGSFGSCLNSKTNSYLQKQRRRSYIFEGNHGVSLSHSNNLKLSQLNSNSNDRERVGEFNPFSTEFVPEQEEVSNFNINLQENSFKTPLINTNKIIDTTLSLFNKNTLQDKRSSIFRDQENFLTNITENEEFNNANLSFDGKSFSESEEEKNY